MSTSLTERQNEEIAVRQTEDTAVRQTEETAVRQTEETAVRQTEETVAFSLDKFGVAFGETIILASLDASFPKLGITILVGPCGSGKSTLLRTIAGLNDAQPNLRQWGTMSSALRGAALVGQHAKLLISSVRENLASGFPNRQDMTQREQNVILEEFLAPAGLVELRNDWAKPVGNLPLVDQRKLSITRVLLSNPSIVLLDEPTTSLSEEDANSLIQYIRHVASSRAVVVTTHNQRHAKALGGQLVLLAGGRIQERGTVADFFAHPETEPGKQFVRSGGCRLPSPSAKTEELADGTKTPVLPPLSDQPSTRQTGPRDFYWLQQGQLSGMPRPGIVADLAYDLDALVDIGVSVLVTLEENVYFPVQALRERNIEHVFLPIVDMEVPPLASAEKLCCRIREFVGLQRAVAVHCRAGKGRTGTLLACYLIYTDSSAVEALAQVRRINPKWIQSDMQVQYLSKFEMYLRR